MARTMRSVFRFVCISTAVLLFSIFYSSWRPIDPLKAGHCSALAISIFVHSIHFGEGKMLD